MSVTVHAPGKDELFQIIRFNRIIIIIEMQFMEDISLSGYSNQLLLSLEIVGYYHYDLN